MDFFAIRRYYRLKSQFFLLALFALVFLDPNFLCLTLYPFLVSLDEIAMNYFWVLDLIWRAVGPRLKGALIELFYFFIHLGNELTMLYFVVPLVTPFFDRWDTFLL